MDFDFNIILVPATLILFAVWLFDKCYLKRRAAIKAGELAADSESAIIRIAYDFWPILALVLIIRSFMIEPYTIPSESMVPGLQIGDFIVVNKFAYGLRLPLSYHTIIAIGEPKRGEVFVFRPPHEPKINYIKRVIGLPGDHITVQGNQVFVNGKAIPRESLVAQNTSYETYYQETWGGHKYTTRDLIATESECQQFVDVTVPADHYFAMGDNRDNSADSRCLGFVPEKNLTGRAMFIWMNKKPGLPSLDDLADYITFSRNRWINQ